MLKIYKATPTEGKGNVGEVIAVDPKGQGSFTVACGSGALKVIGVIPEGKGRMSAGDFVRGRKIALGDILE
jgi:methionyl-tRNA formyltransferase